MKTHSTLTERAAHMRPDYAPLAAPPNPRADEARAALVEYGRGMLQNAPCVEVEAAPPTDMAIATPVNTPHIDDGQAFSTEAVICGDDDMASDGAVLQKMTPRALARFQSFPDSYILPDKAKLACTVIGNAVPPLLYQRVIEAQR